MNTAAAVQCLDSLEAALHAEHQALLVPDVNALVAANERKLEVLALLQADLPAAELQPRLQALGELNRANGALLARRRRAVDWALRNLGRMESACVGYDAQGRKPIDPLARPLASA